MFGSAQRAWINSYLYCWQFAVEMSDGAPIFNSKSLIKLIVTIVSARFIIAIASQDLENLGKIVQTA